MMELQFSVPCFVVIFPPVSAVGPFGSLTLACSFHGGQIAGSNVVKPMVV